MSVSLTLLFSIHLSLTRLSLTHLSHTHLSLTHLSLTHLSHTRLSLTQQDGPSCHTLWGGFIATHLTSLPRPHPVFYLCALCAVFHSSLATPPRYPPPSPFNTSYDGFTALLNTLPVSVTAGATYHFKLAIADAGDHILDSSVWIAGARMGMCSQPRVCLSIQRHTCTGQAERHGNGVMGFQQLFSLKASLPARGSLLAPPPKKRPLHSPTRSFS